MKIKLIAKSKKDDKAKRYGISMPKKIVEEKNLLGKDYDCEIKEEGKEINLKQK